MVRSQPVPTSKNKVEMTLLKEESPEAMAFEASNHQTTIVEVNPKIVED